LNPRTDRQPPKPKSKVRVFTFTLDYEKFNLLKWPLAMTVWSFVGFFVAWMNLPFAQTAYLTLGHALCLMLFGILFGFSIGDLFHTISLISVRLHPVYYSRRRQLYRAPEAAQKKLQKSWEERP